MKRVVASVLLALASTAIAATPQRIVTLSPHLAELVCAAGACDKLAGVVAYTNYPPQAARVTKIGDAFNVDLERVAALKPDLVLAWEGGGGSAQTLARLRALGYRVESLQVRKLDDIARVLTQLGTMLGTAESATSQARAVQQRLDALRERYRGARPLKVFYEIQVQPLYTVNADSPITEAIQLCGGVNVFAGIGTLAGTVSVEALFAANPDVVVYAKQEEASTRSFWRAHPELPAVAAGRLYSVDADLLDRATPRMLDGIEELCGVLARARVRAQE
ncbi:MAG TPA: cobalamin-binding protein [Nevskiaceae bacterium]|nr:cobalamin-binding protein [Nevskiaceae bacterium]